MRLRLDISYDGTEFRGWAAQPGQRTVQGVLTDVLNRILRTPVQLTVAGRTDAGVHATGQVAHLDVPQSTWHDFSTSLIRRLSGVLPPDIRVRTVAAVTADFNARFSALRRHYVYRVSDSPFGGDPLRRRDTHWSPRPLGKALNVDAMNAASNGLLGEHDFAAFCRFREGATTVRALERFEWQRQPDGVIAAHVSADAFCHSMVRSLVGALLAVGEGRQPVTWPALLLTLDSRAMGVTVAPANGLTLTGVDYPPEDQLAARTERTRALRGPVASRANSYGEPIDMNA